MKVWWLGVGLVIVALGGAACPPEEVDCDCGGCGLSGGCIDYAALYKQQEEVQTNLRALFTSQVAYFGEYSTFAHSFGYLGWAPWPPQTFGYAYIIDSDSVQPVVVGPYRLPPWLMPETSEHGFTAVAIGNIDCDPTPDIWTINDLMIMSNYTDDVLQ